MSDSAPRTVDLLVIGGGINGTGIARDAAGRGLDVLLCEQDDLAAHTSSASTKLIHGGLRYLEHRDFRLVRHSLRERAVLLRNAPHIIWPMRFVLPHHAGMRPWWMIRLGLFLYDHLGPRGPLPPCASIDLRRHASGRALQGRYRRAFEYSDCWVQDSRLVVLNARDAHARGAEVRTRTACVSLAPSGSSWEAVLADRVSGERVTVSARSGRQRERSMGRPDPLARRRRRGEAEGQGSSRGATSWCAGSSSTHIPTSSRPATAACSSRSPTRRITPFSGRPMSSSRARPDGSRSRPRKSTTSVPPPTPTSRPPLPRAMWCGRTPASVRSSTTTPRTPSEVTRDYVLHLDPAPAPMLSVYGGKITTYRRLAERAVDMLARVSPRRWIAMDGRRSSPRWRHPGHR